MDTDFCVEAVEDAIARHDTPGIFSTDQGSQFNSQAFTDLLRHDIAINMDGIGSFPGRSTLDVAKAGSRANPLQQRAV